MDPWQYEHGVCTIGNNVLNLTITSSSNNLSKVWTAEGHVIIHRNIKGKLTVKYILVNLQSLCCPDSIGTKWHWTLQRWGDHIPYDHSSFRLGKWLWELRERNIQASSPSFYRSLLLSTSLCFLTSLLLLLFFYLLFPLTPIHSQWFQ